MVNKKINIPYLRFSGFEGDWVKKKLSEIGEFKNGINKSKEDFGFGFPFINLMDVFGKSTISDLKLDLVNANEKELKLYELKKGDVLFIRSSVKKEGVGETSLVVADLKQTVYSGFLIRFRDEKINLNLNFKKYCFAIKRFREELMSLSTTSANTNINQESLNELEIIFPSIDEQEKISSFLSTVDDRIYRLTRKKNLLEKYKNGVMQKIFSREIRFKDDKGKDFPDWDEKSFSEFLTLTTREVNKPSSNYLAIGIRSHFKGTFQKIDSEPEKIAMDKLYVVKENDLIVNITFAWEGAIAIVKKDDEGGLVSHRFPTYIFNQSIVDHSYFQYIFGNKKFKMMLDLISPGGAGRNRVMNKTDFLKLKWMFPCRAEQQKISSLLTSIDKKIELVNSQLEKTKAWKNGLLQKMFV